MEGHFVSELCNWHLLSSDQTIWALFLSGERSLSTATCALVLSRDLLSFKDS